MRVGRADSDATDGIPEGWPKAALDGGPGAGVLAACVGQGTPAEAGGTGAWPSLLAEAGAVLEGGASVKSLHEELLTTDPGALCSCGLGGAPQVLAGGGGDSRRGEVCSEGGGASPWGTW